MKYLEDSKYALRNLWRNVKNKKKNLKYLGLPLIYIIIIMLVIPKPEIVINKYSYVHLDTYRTITITESDKVNYILKNYNLSKEQFKVLCGVVLTEASNSYEDAYAVINTIYNRTHAKNWVRSVNGKFGKGKGNNLYYQAISPGQFTVYASGSYQRRMNDTKSKGYQAIIDFLYTEEIMHDYLSFRSHSIKVKNSEAFSTNGNNYFNILKNENRV